MQFRTSVSLQPRPRPVMARYCPIAAGLAVLLLAACSEVSRPPATAAPPTAIADRLAAAAERAAAAVAELSAIEAHRNPVKVPARPPQQVPEELAMPVHLGWNGPVAGLASLLASRAGWQFAEIGVPPLRPVIVSIDSDGERLIDLLWRIGHQAGNRILVETDATARRISLIYPGTADQ